jgi:anaerobic ribonucleoside-triphosphate reductase activating protein
MEVEIMNYHNITTDDMLNGPGLRTVLWVAGCSHHCKGCQNPETWDPEGGIPFDMKAFNEILDNLNKPYITGITFSGGDPLHENNIKDVLCIIDFIRGTYEYTKSIWLYTGYTYEELLTMSETNADINAILSYIDGLVDGEFIEEQKDINTEWAGSTNQKVITKGLPYYDTYKEYFKF